MKGTTETDVISFFAVTVTTLLLMFMIYNVVNEVFNEFARSSAEVVARDLSSMAALSAAAPHNIVLKYDSGSDRDYEVKIGEQLLNARLLVEGRECGEIFPVIKAEVSKRFCEGLAKMLIHIPSAEFVSSAAEITKITTRSAEGLSSEYKILKSGESE